MWLADNVFGLFDSYELCLSVTNEGKNWQPHKGDMVI